MRTSELVRSAGVEIRAHKMRSLLTCISLSVGVAAILYTFAQIAWMRERLTKAVALSGAGRIEINRKRDYIPRGLSSGLTAADAQAIRDAFPEIPMVYPSIWRWGTRVRFGDLHSEDVSLLGTTTEWRRRDWVYRLQGRFLDEEDTRAAARVCIVVKPGGWIKKPFWAGFDQEKALRRWIEHRGLLGQELLIEDHLFRVVGVIEEPPRDRDPRWFRHWWDWSSGGMVLVPITSYQRYLLRGEGRNAVAAKADDLQVDVGEESQVGVYIRRFEALLATRHRGEIDFEVRDFRERIRGALKRNRENALAVLVIGVVAILAGGIGIMNVTLATIFSRIREIGIRRALGATRAEIVAQFVTEATILGFLGGVAGLPLGFAAARWLSPDPNHIVLPGLAHFVLAWLISIGTGLLFSLLPAWRASRFDPVEALRYE